MKGKSETAAILLFLQGWCGDTGSYCSSQTFTGEQPSSSAPPIYSLLASLDPGLGSAPDLESAAEHKLFDHVHNYVRPSLCTNAMFCVIPSVL